MVECLSFFVEEEPEREVGKHRFMAGTCVDCGHPLDEVCTANLEVYCRGCSVAGGAEIPIFHIPPVCKG